VKALPAGVALGVVVVVSAAGQQATFRSGTETVRVDVLVSERGRPLSGLTAADFEVLDDGVPQNVRLIESEDVPARLSLVLDTSQSVAGQPLAHLVNASFHLLDSLHKGDLVSLIVFDDTVRKLVSEVSDTDVVRRELPRVSAGGRTSLNDAAYAGLLGGEAAEGRRLMMLVSDGIDTASWLGREAVLRAAQREETVVYGIGLKKQERSGGEASLTRGVVEALPATTGGQMLYADSARDLAAVFVKVITEFRQRYWLAYSPSGVSTGDGWHRLTVKVRNRNVKVTSRSGYYSLKAP
jgi:Ca-activated chloride channel family protein